MAKKNIEETIMQEGTMLNTPEENINVNEDLSNVHTELNSKDNMQQDLQLLSKLKQPKGRRVRPGVFREKQVDTVIHTIEANAEIKDPAEEEKRLAAVKLMQSYMTRRPLSGKVFGVRSAFDRDSGDDKFLYYVSVAYGPYQVIIRSDSFADVDYDAMLEKYRQSNPNLTMGEVVRTYLTTRMGAEVDFVVSNIPEGNLTDSHIVGGNRIEAMQFKRIRFWYGTNTDGSYRISEGDKAEARIISVARGGVRIEIYGVESYIPSRELSWNMIQDAASKYKPGDTILVKITKIERSSDDSYHVFFESSAKKAEADRRVEAMSAFQEGGTYLGTVNYIRMPTFERPNVSPAVMVTMPNGIQCHCHLPLSTITPTIGAQVYVTITNRDFATKKLFGKIYRMFEG